MSGGDGVWNPYLKFFCDLLYHLLLDRLNRHLERLAGLRRVVVCGGDDKAPGEDEQRGWDCVVHRQIDPARELGLTGSIISGVKVEADTQIFPCSGSLPMGFSWSLYFCQDAVERWLGGLSLTRHSRLLNDRSGVAVFDVPLRAGGIHESARPVEVVG